MKNKNTLLYIVIIIVILFLCITAATFAYFATTSNIASTMQLTSQTSSSATVFSSAKGNDLSLSITTDKMLQSQASGGDEPVAAEGTATLEINLTGDAGTTCTYSIGYINTGDYIANTPYDQNYEFEISGVSSRTGDPSMPITSFYTIQTGTSSVPKIVISNAQIVIPAGQTSAPTTTWTFTGQFHNLDAPQDLNKTYSGYFKVTSVTC